MRRKNVTSEMMMDYIEQAFLLLMREKPYGQITVSEITARAGVNRSTYYRHFDTRESILRSYLDSIMETYQRRFKELQSGDFPLYLRTMFEAFYEKKEDLLLIHRSGLSYLLYEVLMDQFHFAEVPPAEQFRVSYHIGGIHANMLLWFDHGMRETPGEMTETALQYSPSEALTLFSKGMWG